jgi:hypothetical protein
MPLHEPQKVVKKYEMFHGKKVSSVTQTAFHVPEYLIYLGEAESISYRCNKKNGGGDGKTAIYTHKIETPAKLYMDERCKKQLYIIGSKLIVTEAGIEN